MRVACAFGDAVALGHVEEIEHLGFGQNLHNLDALIVIQSTLQHLVTGQADPHDIIITNLPPHLFDNLHAKAHSIFE